MLKFQTVNMSSIFNLITNKLNLHCFTDYEKQMTTEIEYYECANEYAQNDDDRAIDILLEAIDKFNTNQAKYLLAKYYIKDENYLLDGIELLAELSDTNHLSATIMLIIQLYQMGEREHVYKYALKPFVFPDSVFNYNAEKYMGKIIKIAHDLYKPQVLSKFFKSFPENSYAQMEFKKLNVTV